MPDEDYMKRALDLARRGEGYVNPNPLVGCVIVRDGRIVGEGWHTRCGNLHAEREALADCARRGGSPRGATAYVTLEPCCHWGKTPPCTDALIEAGVARVVVGSSDANPLVAGKGCRILREAGIEVVEGVLSDECRALNKVFFHYIQHKRPYVIAKYAMTLDGKIATRTGASKWITGAAARRRVHEDRARYAGIMVGVGTVLADDPLLTCRLEDAEASDGASGRASGPSATPAPHAVPASGPSATPVPGTDAPTPTLPAPACYDGHVWAVRQPVRIVCDTHLRTPLDARLVATAREVPTLIATCVADEAQTSAYRARGCEVVTLPPGEHGHLDLGTLLDALGARGIDGVIVEGGGTLLGALFDAHLVNAVQAYVAPKVFGGASALGPVAGGGVATPSEATVLEGVRVTQLGCDLLVEGEVI